MLVVELVAPLPRLVTPVGLYTAVVFHTPMYPARPDNASLPAVQLTATVVLHDCTLTVWVGEVSTPAETGAVRSILYGPELTWLGAQLPQLSTERMLKYQLAPLPNVSDSLVTSSMSLNIDGSDDPVVVKMP